MRSLKAFTFLEVILYVAIISIFLVTSILFSWDVVYGGIKSNTQQEVSYNLRLVSSRISYETRNAVSVNSVGLSSISLESSDSSRNPTVIDLNAGQVRIGYGNSGGCPIANPCALTSNRVNVTSLNFENLTDVEEKAIIIKFEIVLEHVNPSNQANWEKSQSYSSSVELRSNSK